METKHKDKKMKCYMLHMLFSLNFANFKSYQQRTALYSIQQIFKFWKILDFRNSDKRCSNIHLSLSLSLFWSLKKRERGCIPNCFLFLAFGPHFTADRGESMIHFLTLHYFKGPHCRVIYVYK